MASTDGRVDILMVEDNPNDEELTLHELRKYHLANTIQVVRDGQEALEYIFCTGRYADRDVNEHPNVILLDIKLPFVDGLEVLRRVNQLRCGVRTPECQMEAGVDSAGVDAGQKTQDLLHALGVPEQLTKQSLADEQVGQAATDCRRRASKGDAEEHAKCRPDSERQPERAEAFEQNHRGGPIARGAVDRDE